MPYQTQSRKQSAINNTLNTSTMSKDPSTKELKQERLQLKKNIMKVVHEAKDY